MKRRVLLFIVFAFLLRDPAQAAPPSLFDRLQAALQTQDTDAYLHLFSSDPALQQAERDFLSEYAAFKPVRTVLRLLRSRGNEMRVQVLMQAEEEARFQLWSIKTGIENSNPVILSRDILSTVDGLYRLRVSPAPYPVQNVDFRHFDALVHLESGQLFSITAGGKVAGVLFIGRGSFVFSPADPAEQQQLGLFCKKPRLETSLQHFYIRASSAILNKYFGGVLSQQPLSDQALHDSAAEIARQSDRNAFGIRLPFSEELWYPRIQGADIYSEMKSDFGTLVYQFAPSELEDILLAQTDRDRIVSLYSSKGRGARFLEEEDFRILSYKMNVVYNPLNLYLTATSEIVLSALTPSSTLIFKLNPSLRVSSIESSEGEVLYFQEKTTFNLHVVLNQMLEEDQQVTLRFRYEGKIDPDKTPTETQRTIESAQAEFYTPPSFLYSNQALWYPQLISKPYSQVETTVQVPSGYAAVANGTLLKKETRGRDTVFFYSTDLPVKYFSLLVGKLQRTLTLQSVVPIQTFYYDLDKGKASKLADLADRILRFYSNYFGKYPYRNLNLALRPAGAPGGHAPAGMVISNRVYNYMKLRLPRDPLWMPDFPDFLLAHEIAHQWWGQAVGWRGYRDQWLSEGFAQFAAAEYMRSVYGDKAWLKLSEEFSDWVAEKTAAGPIVLGTRLGHLTNDPQAFSALVYNKGAYVLNMLKNWMGAENFTKCLAEFYSLYQFKRAGIQDFIEVAQRHSTTDLSPFFEQWLYGWGLPEVTWSWAGAGAQDAPTVKVRFQQPPDKFFHLKIPVEVRDSSGQVFRSEVLVDNADTSVEIKVPFVPEHVAADPLRDNLMNLTEKK